MSSRQHPTASGISAVLFHRELYLTHYSEEETAIKPLQTLCVPTEGHRERERERHSKDMMQTKSNAKFVDFKFLRILPY